MDEKFVTTKGHEHHITNTSGAEIDVDWRYKAAGTIPSTDQLHQ